jgi:hypothetical protein
MMRIVRTIVILAATALGATAFGLFAASEAAKDHTAHLSIGEFCDSSTVLGDESPVA